MVPWRDHGIGLMLRGQEPFTIGYGCRVLGIALWDEAEKFDRGATANQPLEFPLETAPDSIPVLPPGRSTTPGKRLPLPTFYLQFPFLQNLCSSLPSHRLICIRQSQASILKSFWRLQFLPTVFSPFFDLPYTRCHTSRHVYSPSRWSTRTQNAP